MPGFPPIDLSGDHHIHTKLCNHASGEMEEYVQAAVRKGFQSMTFLEHLECGLLYEQQLWLTPELFTQYFEEGERLRTKYAGQITVRLGVEIGWNAAAVDELSAALCRFPFEHRGLSCHFYFDGSSHLNMLSSRQEHINALSAVGADKVLDAYFNSLIEACGTIPCDKLCHLDAALRHLPDVRLTDHHQQQISQLLRLMKEKNIALEVNTSGYAVRIQPYPSLDIIWQASELGITLIPGSDAHHPQQVGRFFERLE
ncbi:MAG: histidinol-phosphatase (PHP family) [Candidatus Electronema aureum]|uniref:Histidinol-phosphatase n=1 Tax=Candidatus Electronema aureum TaxID=2005002 RepID=A0A521G282_9BACT|nr:MAG: histidinol-phosphatase (PHP family) [Candidatus Electronema aureum]